MEDFGVAVTLVFPCGDIHEVLVVAEGFAVLGLALGAEVATARLLAVQGVSGDEACQLEIVGQAQSFLHLGVEALDVAGDADALPEFIFQFVNHALGSGEALLVAAHAHLLPHDVAKLLVEIVDGLVASDAHEFIFALTYSLFGFVEFGAVGGDMTNGNLVSEVVLESIGKYEVAVGEALHEGRGTETVGTVVAEIALASGEEAGNGGLQLVVDPETAHGVVDGGVNHHRRLVGVLVGDFLVHLEEVAIFLFDDIFAEAADGVAEVEVDSKSRGAHAVAGIAAFLSGTAGDVAWHQVAEGWVAAFKVVVAFLFGYVVGFLLSGKEKQFDAFIMFYVLYPYERANDYIALLKEKNDMFDWEKSDSDGWWDSYKKENNLTLEVFYQKCKSKGIAMKGRNKSLEKDYLPDKVEYQFDNKKEADKITHSYSDLVKLLDFEDTADLIIENADYTEKYLTGTWKTSDGKYYFTMKSDGHTTYNLPSFDYGEYYRIENGDFLLYYEKDPDNTRTLFSFEIVTKDIINIYCYKDYMSYRLIRQ